MNEIKIFENPEFGSVRTAVIDGDPWFVANDVAKALGYARPADAVSAHCKGSVIRRYLTNGGEQNMKMIPEGDLYRLIIRSKLESAERFERWLFDDVVPTIRKTGGYYLPQTYAEALRALADKAEEAERLAKQNEEKTALIESMQPKVSYYDLVLQSKDLMRTTEIAKDYGMSAEKFNKLLSENKIQFKQSNRWFLYARYEGMGYTSSKTHTFPRHDGSHGTKTHMYWTQKGRLFLYDFLKSIGVLPMIEMN